MTGGEIGVVTSLSGALDAYRIARAPLCPAYRPPDDSFELIRLTLANKPAKRALGITRGRVDQDALHRPVGVIRFAVNPLPQGCASVATVEAQLTDQSVGERMQKDVFWGNFYLARPRSRRRRL